MIFSKLHHAAFKLWKRSMPFAFVGLAAAISTTPIANAQTIQFGNGDAQIIGVLESKGYTRARITKRGLTIIRAEACKGPDKFQVKVSILGKVTSTKKIGSCQTQRREAFSPRRAVSILEQEGFENVTAGAEGSTIVADACREARRYRIVFNRRGRVQSNNDVGACRPQGLSGDAIAKLLTDQGYRRVTVIDAELPRYVAEACRENQRLRLTLNRKGRVRNERIIGDCERQFDPGNIAAFLEQRGYDRVEVIDRRRPPFTAQACKDAARIEVSIGRYGRIRNERKIGDCRTEVNSASLPQTLAAQGFDRVRVLQGRRAPYSAEACKGNNLFEVSVGRYGRIRSQDRVGRCAAPMDVDALKARLQSEGFSAVEINKRNDGDYNATVCRDATRIVFRYDAYGDQVARDVQGECRSETVLDVLQRLESRGANQTRAIVEGCFKGDKFQWSFDRLGKRTGRERIGNC